MVGYKWQFVSRFRYHAFGWKSDKPIQRIKEALVRIKQCRGTCGSSSRVFGKKYNKLFQALCSISNSGKNVLLDDRPMRHVVLSLPQDGKTTKTPAGGFQRFEAFSRFPPKP